MRTGSSVSKSELRRRKGVSQIESRRKSILDTSERLFLARGLEHTTMADIARAEGITTVTLYRYFPSRDPISFEIAVRKLREIAASPSVRVRRLTRASIRQIALGLIDRFSELRDAYRYMGMFDHLYGDRYPDEKLAAWYKGIVLSLEWGGVALNDASAPAKQRQQAVVLLNAVICFLERMAARGDLLSEEQGIPLDKQLEHFRHIVASYLKRIV